MSLEANASPPALEFARATIHGCRADRARRAVIITESQATRRRARALRRRAQEYGETALQHRWRMWSAGLTGPPNYVPKSWEGSPDADELLERAASTCRECRDVALRRRRFRVVGALCDVTAERLATHHPDRELFLSATARLIEKLEPEIPRVTVDDVLLAGAFARCRESCRAALAGLRV
jgi:hypothetical protein